MPFANGSGRRVAYIPEVTVGVTPATPVMKILRITGGGPRTSKQTAVSEEIRADRNVSDIVHLGQDVAGDYAYELSYGTYDDLLEGLFQSTWATNVLKNGITPKSFTFEETLEMGATDSYQRYVGCQVNSMNFSIASRQIVSGSLGIMGMQETLGTAIIAGETYTAANSEPISTASANVASFTVGGVSVKVKSMQINVTNNVRTRPLVSSLYSAELGSGRFEVTGSLELYFESNTAYQAALDHTSGGALTFTVGNAANKRYTFLLPNIIPADSEIQKGGNSDDVMLSYPFQAVYDAGEAATMKITRAVA